MKALRSRLQQPEAYLRETLERIAVLQRSGQYAATWCLKPENQISNYDGAGDAVAPTEDGGDTDRGDADDDDDDDDDDPDVKFEDVVS